MIYTDGKGTIANVREDARIRGDGTAVKVRPHDAYYSAVWDEDDPDVWFEIDGYMPRGSK